MAFLLGFLTHAFLLHQLLHAEHEIKDPPSNPNLRRGFNISGTEETTQASEMKCPVPAFPTHWSNHTTSVMLRTLQGPFAIVIHALGGLSNRSNANQLHRNSPGVHNKRQPFRSIMGLGLGLGLGLGYGLGIGLGLGLGLGYGLGLRVEGEVRVAVRVRLRVRVCTSRAYIV